MHIFDANLVDTHNGPLRYAPTESAYLEDFQALALGQGISKCLLVQPSFLKCDNSLNGNHVNGGRKPFGTLGVAMVDPHITAGELDSLHGTGYVGIRLNLVQRPDEDLCFPEATFLPLWKKLRERGMHVEIHIEGNRLMKVLEQISPHVDKVVVDHFMRPSEGLEGFIKETPTVYRDLERYGELDKIWVKTSGAYRVISGKPHAEAVQNCRDLAAMLAEILKENRMLWGSDWPFTQNAENVEGETPSEKYAHIARTCSLWSEGGELFDPDAAFEELTGLKL